MDRIEGAAPVVDAFGFWPNFHDGALFKFLLGYDGCSWTLEVLVSGFMYSKDDPWQRVAAALVGLRFEHSDRIAFRLDEAVGPQIIHQLDIDPPKSPDAPFAVEIYPICGLEMRFTCQAVKVISFEMQATD